MSEDTTEQAPAFVTCISIAMLEHWIYTTRCECCGDMIDYTVEKINLAKDNDGYTHEGFRAYVEMMARQRWLDCERCGRITLQTLVAYDRAND